VNQGNESAYLSLSGPDYYYVFPSYGPEFQDMAGWLDHWRAEFPEHRFWTGFSGGGVLAVPLAIPQRQRHTLASADHSWHHKPIYGMVLGNETGQELARCLSCALPDRAPAFAVRLGLAERVPEPTVKATAEHADGLGGQRYLLVVPKAGRRSPKLMERLPAWFGTFGVTIDAPLTEVPAALRAAMRDWFDDPQRPMFALPLAGGEANAAWQLAVAYYVAEHWDIQARGLDSVHFVAEIEGRPNFRKNWTSNR
jgi:hypothetical protein